MTSKLEYLAWLGIDIVWLTPFFASPQADFGYDVSDYCAVEPAYGTLADFDELIEEAHRLDMRVIGDLVPNHTSHQHRWFRRAVEEPRSSHRAYYHWSDPGPGGGPPNNWLSHFGGPAWTLDAASGQYYLHLFLAEQPDLNWSNPEVSAEFERILRFWLDRGLDGYRVDVAHGLTKHAGLPDNPQLRPVTEDMSPREAFASFEHLHDLDQPATKEIYRRWRTIADGYDALLLGEVYLRDNDPRKVALYVADGDGLHRAFYFAPMHTPWEPDAMWDTFHGALAEAPSGLSWAVGSHDDSRAPTRFGGGELGKRRALAFATLLCGLPGLPFIYQGDELALTDVVVAPELSADPLGVRHANGADSRDKVRTPMPWSGGPGAGFTSSASPWLPLGDRGRRDTAEAQRSDKDSWLHRFRRLIAARVELDPGEGELQWLTSRGDPMLGLRRGSVVTAVNVGDAPASITMPEGHWLVRFSVDPGPTSLSAGRLELAPSAAVLLECEA